MSFLGRMKAAGKAFAKGEITTSQLQEQTRGQTGSATSRISTRAPAGLLNTYDLMRENPTIALARAVANAPIKMSTWSIEADDDAPEGAEAFIKEQITPIWPGLSRSLILARDSGYRAHENVYEVTPEGRIGLQKIKVLKSELSEPVIDKATGALVGLKNLGVTLPARKMFWFANTEEPFELEPFGRSLHENIRVDAWWPWKELAKQKSKYVRKAAGVTPIIHYPEGTGKDKNGADIDNFDGAIKLLDKLGKLEGIVMPKIFDRIFDGVQMRALPGLKLQDMMSWSVDFIEPRQQHGDELVNMMKHLESLMLRGWFVPERAATEGQHGTKAEAGVAVDLVAMIAMLFYQQMIDETNKQEVDNLLCLNWGVEAAGSVRMKREGLDPVTLALLQQIIADVLTAPTNIDVFLSAINLDAALDQLGLPKAGEKIRPDITGRTPEVDEGKSVDAALLRLWHATHPNGKRDPHSLQVK